MPIPNAWIIRRQCVNCILHIAGLEGCDLWGDIHLHPRGIPMISHCRDRWSRRLLDDPPPLRACILKLCKRKRSKDTFGNESMAQLQKITHRKGNDKAPFCSCLNGILCLEEKNGAKDSTTSKATHRDKNQKQIPLIFGI
jgi:hypothetical protein